MDWAPSRRDFFRAAAILGLPEVRMPAAEQSASVGGTTAPYLALARYIEPGHDEFAGELAAEQTRAQLLAALDTGALPSASGVQGRSPLPVRYDEIAPDLKSALYGETQGSIAEGWQSWVHSLGRMTRRAVYVLPENVVRHEIASELSDGTLAYRVGHSKQVWREGRLVSFEPMDEHVATGAKPWFRDVTGAVFEGEPSFQQQLAYGVPYWRARLDSATGIDLYGSNGLTVGDIDGDGQDEVYVCQPGGLPNRLYKWVNGQLRDEARLWNVDVLDDSSCALLLDLRNTGRQDLVLLRSSGPTLFLNDGKRFTMQPDAFRFSAPARGTFTGMAAADFDRDGKLDLYLCCYVYFQSEAQYTYAAPYYDAQNGPPNFLFRNRLNADGSGWFEDCTAQTGMAQNNNRFSFAPSWCDFNGDGWPDLYVANDFGRNNLYVNREGAFKDEAEQRGVEDIGPGMSASWFDEDGDGRADLYVANMWSDSGQRIVRDPAFAPAHDARGAEAFRRHTRGNSLFHNRGDGTFDDRTVARHAEFGRWAWSSGGHDLDNDGQPELFVTCGMLSSGDNPTHEQMAGHDLMSFFWRQVVAKSPPSAQASPAYQNGWNAINQFVREDYDWSGHQPNVLHARRGERYYDFSGISGLDFAQDGRAFAITDIDGDGRPDILLKSRLAPQIRVLENDCAGARHSIAFQLQGTHSNRDAIGARVQVDRQVKWLEAGSGFLSQHSKRLLFGTGDAAIAREVAVTWPSGVVQRWRALACGATYFIREGDEHTRSVPFEKRAERKPRPVSGENGLALHDTWFREPVPLPEAQHGPGLLVIDDAFLNGNPNRRLYYQIFRRYLFDWRTGLEAPLALLLNEEGQAVKIYRRPPATVLWHRDLMMIGNFAQLALPFPGRYIVEPQRDLFKFGVAYLWADCEQQAEPYLLAKLKRGGENARVLLLLGNAKLRQQQFAEAAGYLDRSLAIDRSVPEAAYGLGVALAKQGETERAGAAFKQAIENRRDYSDAINDLGALYMQQGKTKDAIAAFRYGVEVAPDQDMLYFNLARACVQSGRMAEARQAMQQLLDRKPDQVGARRALEQLDGRSR